MYAFCLLYSFKSNHPPYSHKNKDRKVSKPFYSLPSWLVFWWVWIQTRIKKLCFAHALVLKYSMQCKRAPREENRRAAHQLSVHHHAQLIYKSCPKYLANKAETNSYVLQNSTLQEANYSKRKQINKQTKPVGKLVKYESTGQLFESHPLSHINACLHASAHTCTHTRSYKVQQV